MCGLFGWALPGGDPSVTPRLVEALLDDLRHRGPNDAGVLFRRNNGSWDDRADTVNEDSELLLGHLRLSILDLSSLGHQPMQTEDGRWRIAYNGEVYNYRELRAELEAEGARFYSHTDTEVVLYAFAYWGLESLSRFKGMFAFALHDAREELLYLVRDHFGIKPLYVHSQGGGVRFASELPALLRFPQLERKANPQRVYDYLVFGDYDSLEQTMIEGVELLPPAHCMVVDTRRGSILRRVRYWKPALDRMSNLSFDEAAERLRELFLDNVRLHLRSDVPLGVALSGGVDSSSVACAVRFLEPDMEIPTFTFVASGSKVDEERWADVVAERIGAQPHKVMIEPSELVDDLDDLIGAQGEPFGSTSIYAQYRVFRRAREVGVTVTLDGQGADELMAGYMGYPGERLKSLIFHGRLMEAWHFFNHTSRWPGRGRKEVFKRLVAAVAPGFLYPMLHSLGKQSHTPAWLNMSWLADHEVKLHPPRLEEVYESQWAVRKALAVQLTQRGLAGLLRHGDRNSMRFSIENRVPFLTREMAEYLLSLPEEYLIDRKGMTKAVFKGAMDGIVPAEILQRKDKIGFATPQRIWFDKLAPWVEETIQRSVVVPVFRRDEMLREWQGVKNRQRQFDWVVWRWLNLIRWMELFEVRFA